MDFSERFWVHQIALDSDVSRIDHEMLALCGAHAAVTRQRLEVEIAW